MIKKALGGLLVKKQGGHSKARHGRPRGAENRMGVW